MGSKMAAQALEPDNAKDVQVSLSEREKHCVQVKFGWCASLIRRKRYRITEGDTIPRGTQIETKNVCGTYFWPPFAQAHRAFTGSGVSSSACSEKDRTEAILYKWQELLINAIYSEDSGVIVLNLMFLRMLLNDLEIQRGQVIFYVALEPTVNEEKLSLECMPAKKISKRWEAEKRCKAEFYLRSGRRNNRLIKFIDWIVLPVTRWTAK